MAKSLSSHSEKAGLPPGSIVHIGADRSDPVTLAYYRYDTISFDEKQNCSLDEICALKNLPGVKWIEVDGIHDPEIIRKIGEAFGIHYLVLEDIANTEQRPKKESFDEYIHATLKMVMIRDEAHQPYFEQVSFLLGPDFVISFQEGEKDVFEPVRNRLRKSECKVRKSGSDQLLYALIDTIVDNYFVILEHIGEFLEELEEELVESPTQETLPKIYEGKRAMLAMRRASWPLRELLNGLTREDSPLIRKEARIYFRDVYDHSVEIIDIIENGREMTTSMLDIYLSSMSNRLNEVMRVLTVITTIFMPLTFIVGLYGMNFTHMPELHWRYGYPAVLAIMLLISTGMVYYFRRLKWL